MQRGIVIFAVGTEMVQGNGLDTNGPWLARELGNLGLNVRLKVVISDDREQLYEALSAVWRDGHSIITIGGLGPTEDDRTRDVIAALLGEKLKKSREARASLSERYGVVKLSDSAKRQTRFPKGTTVLENRVGVAPGFIAQSKDRFICALPGPPREFKPTVRESLLPLLREWFELGEKRASHELAVFGVSEPDTDTMVADLLKESADLRASILASSGKVLLRWQAMSVAGEAMAQERFTEARKRLGRRVILEKSSGGEWHELAERVVTLLGEQKLKVAFAESCTGGQVAEMVTQVPGASAVFDLGVVSYSNAIKQRILQVSTALLVEHGAVSGPCVRAMARGVMSAAKADIAVAVSGIAGPDGGSDEKPVGLVWFGLRFRKDHKIRCVEFPCFFRGGRQRVQLFAALNALDLVRLTLECGALPKSRDVAYFAKKFRPNSKL